MSPAQWWTSKDASETEDLDPESAKVKDTRKGTDYRRPSTPTQGDKK